MLLLSSFAARRILTAAERAEIEAAEPKNLTAWVGQVTPGWSCHIYDDRRKAPIAIATGRASALEAFHAARLQARRMRARSAGAYVASYRPPPRLSLVGRLFRLLRPGREPVGYCLRRDPLARNTQAVCTRLRGHDGLHSRPTVGPHPITRRPVSTRRHWA